MIEMFEENKKEEKIINLSQYQTELDINKCQSDEDFEILHKSIELITASWLKYKEVEERLKSCKNWSLFSKDKLGKTSLI